MVSWPIQLVSYKRDILRPGEGSDGTRDKQAKKRDIPAKTGRLATLHYHMTRVLLLPFLTTVWTPVVRAIINITCI